MLALRNKKLFFLGVFACALTLVVIVLGAHVRLSHAGLGCPDWPGCYGHLVVPESSKSVDAANAAWPDRPLHGAKARKEMLHRYFAGGLGLLVFVMALAALETYGKTKRIDRLPLILPLLIVFQALLGMWTVTLLLKPLVVTLHLLGGMATLALLLWLVLSQIQWPIPKYSQLNGLQRFAHFCLALLVLQIALGGWVSSNYAALACHGFPQCSTQWWPAMDFKDAFVVWRGLGIDYEGGVLDHPARVAIHMTHRLGAALVTVLLLWLCRLVRGRLRELRGVSTLVLFLLAAQIALGVANVTLGLPLIVATAHNAVAALLLAAMVFLIFRLNTLNAR
jgi:cytochrome c oxidase assembly protein subunit 15